MKGSFGIAVFSLFLISCDSGSTTTEKKLDSLGAKIETRVENLGNKIDKELDSFGKNVETTAGKVWDSTKAGAKDLKNQVGSKLQRTKDSIKLNDSINNN